MDPRIKKNASLLKIIDFRARVDLRGFLTSLLISRTESEMPRAMTWFHIPPAQIVTFVYLS